MKRTRLSVAVLVGLMAGVTFAAAQDRGATPSAAGVPAQPPARGRGPGSPTRDPHNPAYPPAKELPDGSLPTPDDEGNFIIGPTHNPAPEMTVKEDVPHGTVSIFTLESADSKFYPGIAREPNTFARADPTDPTKLLVNSHPQPYSRKVTVYVPKQYVPG